MGCGGSKEAHVRVHGAGAPNLKTKEPSRASEFRTDVKEQSIPAVAAFVNVSHTRIQDEYDFNQASCIGRGGCGEIYAIPRLGTNQMFAVKALHPKSPDERGALLREIEVQRTIDHPNIVKVFGCYDTPGDDLIYIVMELCTGGSLFKALARDGVGERRAQEVIYTTLGAVLYLHRHGIVHRDIKAENFMYERNGLNAELKVCDFGFAAMVTPDHEDLCGRMGTPTYMAPELWQRKGHYNSAVDMWAIGVLAFILLSGTKPFHDNDMRAKMRMISDDELRFEGWHWHGVSAEAKAFCAALMQKDPAHRLSASDALTHPWMASKIAESSAAMERAAQELNDPQNHVVEALQAFAHADAMQRASLEAVAFSTAPEQLEQLRALFHKIDRRKMGQITLDEFKAALSEHKEIDDDAVVQLFHAMDISKSGYIDYNEFITASLMSTQQLIEAPCLLTAFRVLDTNGDGHISRDELAAHFSPAFLDAEIDEMLASLHKEQLDFEDFKHAFLQPAEGDGKHRLETASEPLRAALSESIKRRAEGSASGSTTMRAFLKGQGLHSA
jgi:calcium-dependent protein kinase